MDKILIADDESNILMLLEVMLGDIDAEIITAENGEVAIQKAYETQPNLIISDIVMPKKNGFEVCRAVRNNPDIEDIPIILLSALGDEYNKVTGFEEGADDYVVKPFNVEDLKSKVETLLTRYRSKLENESSSHLVKTGAISHENKVSTGRDFLDELLYGGLPVGSNFLLTGSLGTGKSSLARSFIKQGLDQGENALFVALDDDPAKVREQLYQNGLNYEEANQLRIVDAYSWSSMSPNQNEAFAVKGSLELNQLSGLISDASYEIGQTPQVQVGGRRVIDSISSLFVNFELSDAQRFLNQIARTAVAFGNVTSLFILEEGTIEETSLNNIKYVMDGVIELKATENERLCRIASMKWSTFKPDWVSF